MNLRRRAFVGLSVALGLWGAAGCGGGPPSVDSSTTEATVKGVVRINGTLAKNGEITFDPTNYVRKDAAARTAPIGQDGAYTVKTLTGENVIRLSGAVTKKNGALQSTKRAMMVKPGENTFDFVVGEDTDPAK